MDASKKFIIKPGTKVELSNISTDYTGKFKSKEEADQLLAKNLERIAVLQETLYAEGRRSLLVVMQAMDAGGKDGTIKKVFGAMNAQGCHVVSFKAPTEEERKHDYLWRIHKALPEKGLVTIFNRSHYEDVLIARVRNLVPENIWKKRYEEINTFEKFATDNGTHILKFFLHIGKKEQLKRFWDRVNDSSKHWKISESDYTEREKWKEYQEAYEDALSKCSTEKAPWYVIPADRKWFRNAIISQIVVDYLEGLKMQMPKPSVNPQEIREKYFMDKGGKIKPPES